MFTQVFVKRIDNEITIKTNKKKIQHHKENSLGLTNKNDISSQGLNCEEVKVKEFHIGEMRNLARAYKSLDYFPYCQLFYNGTSTFFINPTYRTHIVKAHNVNTLQSPNDFEMTNDKKTRP